MKKCLLSLIWAWSWPWYGYTLADFIMVFFKPKLDMPYFFYIIDIDNYNLSTIIYKLSFFKKKKTDGI
jgi:hypothetical protein